MYWINDKALWHNRDSLQGSTFPNFVVLHQNWILIYPLLHVLCFSDKTFNHCIIPGANLWAWFFPPKLSSCDQDGIRPSQMFEREGWSQGRLAVTAHVDMLRSGAKGYGPRGCFVLHGIYKNYGSFIYSKNIYWLCTLCQALRRQHV